MKFLSAKVVVMRTHDSAKQRNNPKCMSLGHFDPFCCRGRGVLRWAYLPQEASLPCQASLVVSRTLNTALCALAANISFH